VTSVPAADPRPEDPVQPADPAGPADVAESPAPQPRPRASVVAAWFVVVEALFVLTTAPALVWLLVLDWRASDLPLAVALLIPVGPATAASVFAWRKLADEPDLGPVRAFWRGYRLDWADALRVWTPALAVLAVLAVNLVNLRGSDLPAVFGVVGGVVAVIALVWTGHALVVVSLFSFRWRDVARIGTFFLVFRWRPTLGLLAIAALAGAVVVLVGAWLLLPLASVLTFLLWWNARPLVAEIHRRFVVGAPEAPQPKPWPGLDAADAEETGADDGPDDAPDDARADG